jgi:hypothetical protein
MASNTNLTARTLHGNFEGRQGVQIRRENENTI